MADTNIFSMVDSWNNAGVTFTAIQMNVTDTASQAGSWLMDLQVGGASKFNVNKNGTLTTINTNISGSLALQSAASQLSIFSDVILVRDAAGILAQRNGVNAQIFNAYNTFTDVSNYERVKIGWAGNAFSIATERSGTGTARSINISSLTTLNLGGNGGTQWQINASGHLFAITDNAIDIGASGANRPRNVYQAGHHFLDGNVNLLSSTAAIQIGNPADVILTRDAANILAMRNGVNGQTFSIYNTYTDASNYEKLSIGWGANLCILNVNNAGTGTLRALALNGSSIALQSSGVTRWTVAAGSGADLLAAGAATIRSASTLAFRSNGAGSGWQINLSGHLVAEVDNTYDIGASGATRPRNMYIGTSLVVGGTATIGGLSTFSKIGVNIAPTTSAQMKINASDASTAQINLVVGVAPTAPNDGDIWREDNTNTGIKIRVNGVTKTVTLS